MPGRRRISRAGDRAAGDPERRRRAGDDKSRCQLLDMAALRGAGLAGSDGDGDGDFARELFALETTAGVDAKRPPPGPDAAEAPTNQTEHGRPSAEPRVEPKVLRSIATQTDEEMEEREKADDVVQETVGVIESDDIQSTIAQALAEAGVDSGTVSQIQEQLVRDVARSASFQQKSKLRAKKKKKQQENPGAGGDTPASERDAADDEEEEDDEEFEDEEEEEEGDAVVGKGGATATAAGAAAGASTEPSDAASREEIKATRAKRRRELNEDVIAARQSPMRAYIPKIRPMRFAKMSRDNLIDVVFNIFEKKAVDDKFREEKGIELSTFPEFIEDFFLNKYGLESVAFGKLQSLVMSLIKFGRKPGLRFKYARVAAAMCGLVNSTRYSPDLSRIVIRLMRSIYPQHESITEQFRLNHKALRHHERPAKPKAEASAAERGALIPTAARSSVIAGLIGSGATLSDPSTWIAPHLLRVSAPDEVGGRSRPPWGLGLASVRAAAPAFPRD